MATNKQKQKNKSNKAKFRSLLHSIDAFGQVPTNKWSHETPVLKSSWGAFFTILSLILILMIAYEQYDKVMRGSKSTILTMNRQSNLTEIGEVNLIDYEESFTVIVSMNRMDYKLIDNPFV